jgi:hypothetical protein
VPQGWMRSMTGSERGTLTRALATGRNHVLSQLQGLTDDQLRAPVAPSGWTPLGLVRHLTLSDERYWFQVVVDGRPLDFWPDGHNADWLVAAEEPADAVIAAYIEAIAVSDDIIAETDLDSPPTSPEPGWEEAGLAFPDLRSVLLHVIVETSVHAGHLDLVRELLDGRQHIVL